MNWRALSQSNAVWQALRFHLRIGQNPLELFIPQALCNSEVAMQGFTGQQGCWRELQIPSPPGNWGSRPAHVLPPDSNSNSNLNRCGGRPDPTSVGSWKSAPWDGSGTARCQQESEKAGVWAQVKRRSVNSSQPEREKTLLRSGRPRSRKPR